MIELDFEIVHQNLLDSWDGTRLLEGLDITRIWQKTPGEHVSDLDLRLGERLEIFLQNVFFAPVFSEEKKLAGPFPDVYWLVDPLDGTHNRIMGIGPTAISLALMVRGWPAVGMVYHLEDKYFGSSYLGVKSKSGDDETLTPATSEPLIGLSTGIIRQSLEGGIWAEFLRTLTKLGRIRIYGSQALQGLWVSQGKLQMSFSYESRAWDDCAAGLLVNESGGDWWCFVDKETQQIQPDSQTSSTFVSNGFRKESEEAGALFAEAISRVKLDSYILARTESP